MLKNKKIISWLLVMIWMGIIFYLSHQPATQSNELSTGITQKIIKSVEKVATNLDIDTRNFNHIIRKMAHFTAYFILGVLVLNAIKQSYSLDIKWALASIIICILYAISDEVHQAFIPGRGPAVFDVLIDSLGATTGILLYKMFHVKHFINIKEWWNLDKRIKLNQSNKEEMKKKIKEYFSKERDEDLGELASELILDFFLKELAPNIYNQGVEDSYTYMQNNIEDLLALKIIRR